MRGGGDRHITPSPSFSTFSSASESRSRTPSPSSAFQPLSNPSILPPTYSSASASRSLIHETSYYSPPTVPNIASSSSSSSSEEKDNTPFMSLLSSPTRERNTPSPSPAVASTGTGTGTSTGLGGSQSHATKRYQPTNTSPLPHRKRVVDRAHIQLELISAQRLMPAKKGGNSKTTAPDRKPCLRITLLLPPWKGADMGGGMGDAQKRVLDIKKDFEELTLNPQWDRYTLIHPYIHSYTLIYTLTPLYTPVHPYIHSYTLIYTHIPLYTPIHPYYTHTPLYKLIHPYIYSYTLIYTYTPLLHSYTLI